MEKDLEEDLEEHQDVATPWVSPGKLLPMNRARRRSEEASKGL
tara:strand:- start:309 stop:437 length:129 start_codon:yes stop_codon:yes gene_type:complete